MRPLAVLSTLALTLRTLGPVHAGTHTPLAHAGAHTHLAHAHLATAPEHAGAQAPLALATPAAPPDEWSLARAPPANATGHLIFDTVRSLLQRWPNTRYRNGHALVPATVPPGTLLYHGTTKDRVPVGPEWIATDPEHSLMFCPEKETADAEGEPDCWHLTLATTRALKVIYFDGNSAAKMEGGPMDSQDLVAWGAIRNEMVSAEEDRITALCAWAAHVGVDGFVRMEMDFEMMLCDFTAGVEVVSFLNLSSPKEGQRPIDPTAPLREQASSLWHVPGSLSARVLEAGSWHNAYPGDARIVLDYTRVLTFYDTDLAPDLAGARAGVPRLQHRLGAASTADFAHVMEVLDTEVRAWVAEVDARAVGTSAGSGVDWRTLLNTIAERYAGRLEALAHILSATTPGAAARAQRQVRAMLAPYVVTSAKPPAGDGGENTWAAGVYEQCTTAHTAPVAREEARLRRGERVLLGAAQEVSREICRVLVGVWAEGIEAGIGAPRGAGKDAARVLAVRWRARIDGLMAWLDWSGYWLRCRPACGLQELCVLPTWPFLADMPGRKGPKSEVAPDWEDPQPFCTRIVELEDDEEYL